MNANLLNRITMEPGKCGGKDSDFVDLVSRHGIPPQLLWVTCGNLTNTRLQAVFDKTLAEALAVLSSGQPIVEIG